MSKVCGLIYFKTHVFKISQHSPCRQKMPEHAGIPFFLQLPPCFHPALSPSFLLLSSCLGIYAATHIRKLSAGCGSVFMSVCVWRRRFCIAFLTHLNIFCTLASQPPPPTCRSLCRKSCQTPKPDGKSELNPKTRLMLQGYPRNILSLLWLCSNLRGASQESFGSQSPKGIARPTHKNEYYIWKFSERVIFGHSCYYSD